MTISQLSAMPATAFLNPKNFKTLFDREGSKYGQEQYAKGLAIGNDAKEVHISIRNVWSATTKTGGSIQSYETLGYHSETAELLRGFIDSGVTIVVWRDIPDPDDDLAYRVVDTVIQGER